MLCKILKKILRIVGRKNFEMLQRKSNFFVGCIKTFVYFVLHTSVTKNVTNY